MPTFNNTNVYMYLCVRIYIYVCIYMYIYIYVCIYVYLCVYVYIYIKIFYFEKLTRWCPCSPMQVKWCWGAGTRRTSTSSPPAAGSRTTPRRSGTSTRWAAPRGPLLFSTSRLSLQNISWFMASSEWKAAAARPQRHAGFAGISKILMSLFASRLKRQIFINHYRSS